MLAADIQMLASTADSAQSVNKQVAVAAKFLCKLYSKHLYDKKWQKFICSQVAILS